MQPSVKLVNQELQIKIGYCPSNRLKGCSSGKDMSDESAADRDLTLRGVAAVPLGGRG
jgi:hypothetical protein